MVNGQAHLKHIETNVQCHKNALCGLENGESRCICKKGYTGDGYKYCEKGKLQFPIKSTIYFRVGAYLYIHTWEYKSKYLYIRKCSLFQFDRVPVPKAYPNCYTHIFNKMENEVLCCFIFTDLNELYVSFKVKKNYRGMFEIQKVQKHDKFRRNWSQH